MRLFTVKKKFNEDLNSQKKKIGLVRKVLVVTGCMMALFMCAPVVNNPMLDNVIGIEQTYASELPYSHRWETQANGDWKYKLDAGGYATTAWVQDEVDHNWYLLGDNGIMRSGIFESYGKYYLLSEIHDGHFGHLVKNGEVYQGITIKADTSKDYEGALSQESINALKAIGYQFTNAVSVTGTQHVSNGHVTHQASNTQTKSTTSSTQSNNNFPYNSGLNTAMEDATDFLNKHRGYDPNADYNTNGGFSQSEIEAGKNFVKNRD